MHFSIQRQCAYISEFNLGALHSAGSKVPVVDENEEYFLNFIKLIPE